MTATFLPNEMMDAFRLEFPDSINVSGPRFFQLCAANRDLRIERSACGEIIVMPPTDTETGRRNSELTIQLGNWAKRDGTGLAFDSSTGFQLPNGATRSPDASWILKSKLKSVPKRRKGFMKVCPDFVIELRSPTDRLVILKSKMDEYLANGAQLGWLIDPSSKLVYIYQPNRPVERHANLKTLAARSLLPGFTLDLAPIWAREL